MQDQMNHRISLLRDELVTEVTSAISQQFSELKGADRLHPRGALTAAQLDELKDHMTTVQSIDTEFWQTLQAEAIQQAHDISRETAEDIARRAIEMYGSKIPAPTKSLPGFPVCQPGCICGWHCLPCRFPGLTHLALPGANAPGST